MRKGRINKETQREKEGIGSSDTNIKVKLK